MPYNSDVMSEGLLKYASGVWFRPPGLPFTFAGTPDYQERLTGMTEWAPRKMVERMAEGLRSGHTVEDLVKSERSRGMARPLVVGALGGGVGGGVLARILGGEATTAPFKELLEKGLLKKRSLGALGKLPTSVKLLPFLGAGAGLLAGGALWGSKGKEREGQATQVARGLLAERVLQRNALKEALKSEQPYNRPLLQGVPLSSASTQTPYAVTLGNTGM